MKITHILNQGTFQIATLLALVLLNFACNSPAEVRNSRDDVLQTGAEQTSKYLPLLRSKNVGITVNHTALIGNTLLIDSLRSLNISVTKIFSPEHSVRGNVDGGFEVNDTIDARTGIPIISLYGKQKKPPPESLKDFDVIVFDLQDVGARFYTYISTMHYVMEACAENDIPLIVLDRPNPNSHYIDGPLRKRGFESFVGMHPIPVVHAMTVGELAQMINGEKWLKNGVSCDLTVIPVANYSHGDPYSLPVKPSPNLPNDQSVLWYSSLCLFEGTVMSIGRGTNFPFQVIGYPDSTFGSFTFNPVSMPGKSTYPKHQDSTCYGVDLRHVSPPSQVDLTYLIKFYNAYGSREDFFTDYFNTLAGTDLLKKQIMDGMTEEEIRASWRSELEDFKALRKKYLLYPDFE